ncbi:protein giant-like isoform X5 [Rhodnius prolixus]|uniref:Giant n=3 Tax=Rhodnius prolixus TaxID=13249 RepID=G0Z066_RHOPR|nr:giant [Rhodnius prolixus]
MLGLMPERHHEPIDYTTGFTGVLDLRTTSSSVRSTTQESEEDCSRSWCSSSPIREEMESSPPSPPIALVSPTLAITQRVLQAANTPQGTRPFKAYPKDPVFLADGQNEAYLQFRQQMLSQVRNQKSISVNHNNNNIHQGQPPLKKRAPSPQHPTSSGADSADDKDAAYWERRRKNNEAAKRSRDARRAKEDEIAIRAAFLEQENLKLKYQIAALTDETAKLRCMLYKTEPIKHSAFTPLHLDTQSIGI